MDVERWKQVEPVLDAALDRPPGERAAYLDEACADDPALRAEVEALLDAEARAPSFLDEDAAGLAAPMLGNDPADATAAPSDDHVGPYRLVEEIGRGGMSVVYRAERADGQFEQQVALKLLPRYFETETRIARFRAERQILAALDHPNIAHLLDGGVTETGRPYLVMEHVEGQPITTYCQQHALSIKDRLSLLRTACQAVQYAHQNLVVHRDLKPPNILVTHDGRVKLLDFGIAKLLDAEASPLTVVPVTRTGEHLMTPEYAAPEQIRGEAISTTTDVYQLGVLTYEMLTGQRPFDIEGHSLSEIERIVLEQTPTRPSTAVTQKPPETATPPTRLPAAPSDWSQRLRGDLDTIVLKALRKEPERRYASVAALADDLQHYLAGRPVTARPATWRYRTRKFIQRNRGKVATGFLIALLIVGYGLTVTVQARRLAAERDRARTEAEKAEAVSSFLADLFIENVPRQTSGDTLTALEVLDRGRTHIDRLDEQPEAQLQLLRVMGEVYEALGQYDRADSLLSRASARTNMAYNTPHPEVGQLFYQQGQLQANRGRYAEAESLYHKALDVYAAADHLETTTAGQALSQLAFTQFAQGRHAAADSLYRATAQLYEHLVGANHPYYATILANWVQVLRERGDFETAETQARKALAIREQHFDPPHIDIAYSHGALGTLLHKMGALDEGRTHLERALDMKRTVLGPDHPDLATASHQLAYVLADLGEYDRAIALYKQAIERYLEIDPQGLSALRTQNNLALVYQKQARYEEAAAIYRKVLRTKRRVVGNDQHPSIAVTLYNLASVYHEQGNFDEAEPMYRRVIHLDRMLRGDDHPEVGVDLNALATLLRDREALVAADTTFARARPIIEAEFPEGHKRRAELWAGLGGLHVLQDRPAVAEPLLRKALDLYANGASAPRWRIARTRGWLGEALLAQGQPGPAAPLLRNAHAALVTHLGLDDWRTRHVANVLRRLPSE